MNRFCWWLVEKLSRTLAPDERDAVLGDFAEAGQSGSQALRDLIGLVVRRQAALWRGWGPWLAPIGLVAPVVLDRARSTSGLAGVAWIGVQLRTLCTYGVRYEAGMSPGDDIVTLVCAMLVPVAWAWSGGFVLGSLARRTAWMHPALLLPLVGYFLVLLQVVGSGRLKMIVFWLLPHVLLILIPFLWGVRRGVRGGTIRLGRAAWFAASIALMTLITQVEDGRSSLALAAWSSGGAADGGLVWTPQLLPFAAIVWQFGSIFAATRYKENTA